MTQVTYTETSRTTHKPLHTTAPNGSSSGWEYWTTIVQRQVWADVPENGIYAGRSYKITLRHMSTDPNTLGTGISSSSTPWTD
jgi:hypothetical protein